LIGVRLASKCKIVIAALCLIATAAYILYQADQQAILETRVTAESIDKQLELQLLRIDAGFGQPERFPNLAHLVRKLLPMGFPSRL